MTPAVPKEFGRAFSMPEERSPIAGSGHEVQDLYAAKPSPVVTRHDRLNWICFCDPVLCNSIPEASKLRDLREILNEQQSQ